MAPFRTPHNPNSVHPTADSPASPLRVLVIDDHEAKRYLIARTFQQAGYAVSTAADGATGLEQASSADVVVLDVRLPGMDGFEILRRLKASPLTAAIPVVQISASGGIGDRLRSIEGGAVAFIDQPDPAILLATVRMLIREREARERVIEILEQTGDAFLAVDRNWKVLQVNRNQEQVSQIRREDSVGRNFWELFPVCADPHSQYWIQLHRAAQTREPVSFEDYYAPLQIWVEVRAFPGRDGGLALFSRDITFRKRQEEALRRSEQHSRALITSLAEGVVVHAADGSLVQANPAAERLLGLSSAQLQGLNPRDPRWNTLREDGTPMPAEEHAASVALRSGEPVTGQVMGVERADGSRIWLMVNAHPIFGQDGEVSLAVASFFDLTQQREAELEERNRARFEQELIGIVSHDLRNPISTVLLSAAMAHRRTDLDERTRRAFTRIVSASERANRMIRDLLDFTRARMGGGIPLSPTELDVHGLAAHVLEELRLSRPSRRLVLESSGDGQGRWDADRLAQLLINLTENAVKYSPEDSEVTVRTRCADDEARIEVHNRGEPIPLHKQPQLFEPLQRGTDAVDQETRSIGLGLYIVRRIAEAHGGKVFATSTAEDGTRFTVVLPRLAAPRGDAADPEPSPGPAPGPA